MEFLLRADVVTLAAIAAHHLHDRATVDIELMQPYEAHAAADRTAQAATATLWAGMERAWLIAITAGRTGGDGETAMASASTTEFAFGAALVRKTTVY